MTPGERPRPCPTLDGDPPAPTPLVEVLADPASYMGYETALVDPHTLVELARNVVYAAGPAGNTAFHEVVAPLARFLDSHYPEPGT